MTEAGVLLGSLLEEMVAHEASDLHLSAGGRPRLRVDGRIRDLDSAELLTGDDTAALAREILDERQRERLRRSRELDLAFIRPGLGRFRANAFHQRGTVALAIRAIPATIRSLEELGLPPVVRELARRRRGLVLVTGPAGSGKSTTLSSMVDGINRERPGHIVTIEDPVEYIHRHQRSVVNQRQVGSDTISFVAALRHALRQDPDVILIGEMRDPETVRAALTAAETGHLVLATLHTHSAPESVGRIVGSFPSHQQRQVRHRLSMVLEGVVTQSLLPRASGPGRALATETLVATPAVRALIRDDRDHQLRSAMQAGRRHGMHTLDDSLLELVSSGEVAAGECLALCTEPGEMRRQAFTHGTAPP